MRRGSSLIEALFALLLLQFGLLAIVAASAVAARDLGTANRRVRAQAVARSRVEGLRARGCVAPLTGHATWPGGLEEFWRVESFGSLRVITDSVEMRLSRGRRTSHVFRGSILCRP